MKIDLEKIETIYGNNCIYEIKDNLDDVVSNINYLNTKGFTNVYEIVESYPYLFIESNDIFIEKIDLFLTNIGFDYLDILSNDMTLWGDIL